MVLDTALYYLVLEIITPDSKVHGANMGPTWVLSAPDGPHVSPMNLAIRDFLPIKHLFLDLLLVAWIIHDCNSLHQVWRR